MKICYLANAVSIHTQRWVKYFADKGREVHLISPRPFDSDIENVKLHLLKRCSQICILFFIANLPVEIFQIRKILKKIKPDIIHAHYVADYGFHAALMNFHPFVLSVWGSDVLVAPKKSYSAKMMVKYALKKADVVITTAKFMKGYLVKEFKISEEKIIRIPWGIDLKIFHRGYEKEVKKLREELDIPYDAPVIISNRHLSPKYNIHLIVESIPYVIKNYPDVVFIFIRGYGTEEFEEEIIRLAKNLGVNKNLKIIPKLVSPHEMAVYLNLSDIMISIPSTDQFASSIMEGMACGTIPIVSNIEVYKQYLEDGKNAFFVSLNDPQDLAKKIIYAIDHLPKLKDKFYKINRKIIEEYENWEKNAIKMEELYEELAGKR